MKLISSLLLFVFLISGSPGGVLGQTTNNLPVVNSPASTDTAVINHSYTGPGTGFTAQTPLSAILGLPVSGNASTAQVTTSQTGGVAQALAAHYAEVIDLQTLGGVPDGMWVSPNQDGGSYGATMTAGSAVLTTTHGPFTAAMVGKKIYVVGAGVSGGVLESSILSFQSANQVTLANNASTSVPITWIGQISNASSTITASYAPGDTVTFATGTYTTAGVGTIDSTTPANATVDAAGSGGTANATCTLTGSLTGGTPTNGVSTITLGVTLTSGGGISAINSISGAQWSANPSSLTGVAVSNQSGCGSISGATVNVLMGPDFTYVSTQGNYTATPSGTPSSTSGSGAGAVFSLKFPLNGEFLVGTDNTAVINQAVADVNAWALIGVPACIYAPPGNYAVFGTSLTQFADGVPGCVMGSAGEAITQFLISPVFSGPVFSASQGWLGNSHGFGQNTTSTWQTTSGAGPTGLVGTGPVFAWFTITGDRADTSQADAIDLYDQNDEVVIDHVTVNTMPGACISAGALTENATQAYMRESRLTNDRCFSDGLAANSIPAVTITSVGTIASNETDISELQIYAPYYTGLLIDSGGTNGAYGIHGDGVRIEGVEQNPTGVQSDLLQIGDSSNTTATAQDISIHGRFYDPYFGGYAIAVLGGGVAASPYGLEIGGYVGGGAPYGGGLNVQIGRSNTYNLTAVSTFGYDITFGEAQGSGGYVGAENLLRGPTLTAATWSLGTGAYADVLTDTLQFGNPTAYGTTGAWQLPVGTTGQEPACSSSTAGQVRGNSTTGFIEYCNGSAWTTLATVSGATGSLIGYSVITSSGSYTPPTNTGAELIRAIGSGGCGGAAQSTSSSQWSIGGGGGSGAFAEAYETTGLGNPSLTVSIGGAPSCGTSNGQNSNGSSTTIGGDGWTLTAPGGKGGFGSVAVSAATYESGGPASSQATVGTGSAILGAGAPGSFGAGSNDGSGGSMGGVGGSNPFGAGGGVCAACGAGNAATAYGAGGGGADNDASQASAVAGGAGGPGIVVVMAFHS